MNRPAAWLQKVRLELERAEAARMGGNEGMARVCARRAAGWTVQAYLGSMGIELKSNNVLDQFRYLLNEEMLAPALKPILEHMLQPLEKKDPLGESVWPLEANLVAEAQQLLRSLFPDLQ